MINPFLGIIQAFKYYRQDWAKNSVWLFVIFYGFTMFRPEEMDSNRYVLRLADLYDAPLSWDSFIANFYTDEGSTVDIYQPLVTYFLSLFTKNPNILFAVFGITFGYFYSRNIWLLLDLNKEKRPDRTAWILLFAFACVIGFWELNGVRMWTAAHMFFYGSFIFLVKGKKKGLLIAGLSVLVHYSFTLPVALLLAYSVVKLPWKILYIVFLASFFISELNVTSIGNFLSSISPDFLVPRINIYTNDDYVETVADAAAPNWYVIYYLKCIGWVISILISYIYFTGLTSIKSKKSFSNWFGFTLLFLTVGNLMSTIPSGGRYRTIAWLFALALLFMFYTFFNNRNYSRYLTLLSPLLMFFIVVSIRISFDTTTVITLLGNPLIALLIDLPVPLINLIK